MRLSEAILLGSTSVRPIAGVLLSDYGIGPSGCALGMACFADAVDVPREQTNGLGPIYNHWPWTIEEFECPCGCGLLQYAQPKPKFSAAVIAAHIFDWHIQAGASWTLEQLVDWVRSVEPPEPDQGQATGVLGRDPLETNQESRSVDEKVVL